MSMIGGLGVGSAQFMGAWDQEPQSRIPGIEMTAAQNMISGFGAEDARARQDWARWNTGANLTNQNAALFGAGGHPGLIGMYERAGVEGNRILANNAPATLAALRGIDPRYTGLMDALTSRAEQDMALGGTLSPDEIYKATAPTLASYAGRGVFGAPMNQLAAGLQLYAGGQDLLSRRTARASGIADQLNQAFRKPTMDYWSGTNPSSLLTGAGGLTAKNTGYETASWVPSYLNAVMGGNFEDVRNVRDTNVARRLAGADRAQEAWNSGGGMGTMMNMFGG